MSETCESVNSELKILKTQNFAPQLTCIIHSQYCSKFGLIFESILSFQLKCNKCIPGHCMIKKLDPKKESHPDILDNVLTLYKFGAPCHTSLFHKHKIFRTLPRETHVEKCVIKCKSKNLLQCEIV